MWPTVDRVAEECELSVRTVQRVLEEFVAEGMLIVVRRGGAGPGSSTRYDFDLARVRTRSAEIAAGCAKGDSVTPLDKGVSDDAKGDNCAEKGCHRDTRTVIEPSTEPSLERGRAREGKGQGEAEAKAPGGRAFKRAFAAWPTFVSNSEPAARKAWEALSAEERAAAIDRQADYVASVKGTGRSKYCKFDLYLSEKRWEKLPPRPAPPTELWAPAFGPLWNAICLRELLLRAAQAAQAPPSAFIRDLLSRGDEAGRRERLKRQAAFGWPKVNGWYQQAASRKGFTAKAEDAWLAGLMEPVPVNSDVMADWRAEYDRRGWPWLPDPGGMRVVYFPAGGPGALDAFERASEAGRRCGSGASS